MHRLLLCNMRGYELSGRVLVEILLFVLILIFFMPAFSKLHAALFQDGFKGDAKYANNFLNLADGTINEVLEHDEYETNLLVTLEPDFLLIGFGTDENRVETEKSDTKFFTKPCDGACLCLYKKDEKIKCRDYDESIEFVGSDLLICNDGARKNAPLPQLDIFGYTDLVIGTIDYKDYGENENCRGSDLHVKKVMDGNKHVILITSYDYALNTRQNYLCRSGPCKGVERETAISNTEYCHFNGNNCTIEPITDCSQGLVDGCNCHGVFEDYGACGTSEYFPISCSFDQCENYGMYGEEGGFICNEDPCNLNCTYSLAKGCKKI